MTLINLLSRLLKSEPLTTDIPVVDEVVSDPPVVPIDTSDETLLLLILGALFYVLISLTLWFMSNLNKPYLAAISATLYCFIQLVMIIWFALCDNAAISLVSQSCLLLIFVLCLAERVLLALRVRSLAPFVHSTSKFVIITTTNSKYVFPIQEVADYVVVLTNSMGVLCNGVFMQGAIAVTDSATIITRFSSRVLLLDRVEHGYDYTVFVYVSAVVLENTHRVDVPTNLKSVEL